MKIALYYPWIYLKSGIERTIYQSLTRSQHTWDIYTNHYDKKNTFPELSHFDINLLNKVSVKRSFFNTIKSVIAISMSKIDLDKYDALLVHSEGLGNFITLRNYKKPIFCYCHTPVRSVYDPIYIQQYLKKNKYKRLPLLFFQIIYKIVEKKCWKKYTKVFVNSEEVKNRILINKLVDPQKIEVLNPGFDMSISKLYNNHNGYFLVAGRIMWTKNIELAINAFKLFNKSIKKYKLIIAGIVDEKSKVYINALKDLGDNDIDIQFVINPSDDQLLKLYQECIALLYTPLNEDFGMVPIEAMAFGKLVIAVDKGGPKETIIDNITGYLVKPDPAEFCKKMITIINDEKKRFNMGLKAFENSQKYDWNKFVERLDSSFSQNL